MKGIPVQELNLRLKSFPFYEGCCSAIAVSILNSPPLTFNETISHFIGVQFPGVNPLIDDKSG